MRIAVCDDEISNCQEIKKIITEFDNEYKIDIYLSGELLLEAGEYDIYFLDIQMKGIDGIRLAQRIRDRESHLSFRSVIIFISGYKQHMQQAFDVQAYHYLLKPIDQDKFREVFQNVVSDFDKQREREEKFLVAQIGGITKKILLNDIYYIDIYGKKATVHGEHIEFSFYEKMDQLESKLSKDGFFRCHRSWLVNLKYISEYDAKKIVLANGFELPLPKQKYAEFTKTYLQYLKEES